MLSTGSSNPRCGHVFFKKKKKENYFLRTESSSRTAANNRIVHHVINTHTDDSLIMISLVGHSVIILFDLFEANMMRG